jgi:hypothetical protein
MPPPACAPLQSVIPSMLLPHYYEFVDGLRVVIGEPDARVQGIPEAVVQELWQHLRFDHQRLRTTDGQPVRILDPGRLNTDGGPDFTGARLRIGDVEWSGDVEIHRTSGEWLVHRHDEDPRYDRVVLHAALLGDSHTGLLRRTDGTLVPEVVLYPYLGTSLRSLLHQFYARPPADFYCSARWSDVPEPVRRAWTRALGRQRLRERERTLGDAFQRVPDLETLLYHRLMRALGYAPNAEPMERLARLVPLPAARSVRNPSDLEALMLGAAGLLPEPSALLTADRQTADVVMDLRERAERLLTRSSILPMRRHEWQFFRLRPPNFPTRRVVQAAALLAPGGLLSADPLPVLAEALRDRRPLHALRALIGATEPSPFWRDHYLPERRAAAEASAAIGRARADELVTNAILPVLLLHAEQAGDAALEERVLGVYERLPAASDEVTRRYEAHGSRPRNAVEAQGQHALYRDFCAVARCLSCRIGEHLLAQG